jgi:hypothetical protein
MRVLLSTIGSRGDVQPLVALASHVKQVAARQLESMGTTIDPCPPGPRPSSSAMDQR